jgi:hypothetical protein
MVTAGAVISSAGVSPAALAPLYTLAAALEKAPARRALGELLLEEQIGLGHDPGHPPLYVQDR